MIIIVTKEAAPSGSLDELMAPMRVVILLGMPGQKEKDMMRLPPGQTVLFNPGQEPMVTGVENRT